MQPDFSPTRTYAEQLDRADLLRAFKARFIDSEPDMAYMDGNSLGRLSVGALEHIQAVMQTEWGRDLIRSWNTTWYRAPQRVGKQISQLAGAAPGQLVVTDSTSVNLYKLVMAALEHQSGRRVIVSDTLNFPSDLYIIQGCIHTLGSRHTLHQVSSADHIAPDLDALYKAIDSQTALVTLSHVVFKSGYLYDAAELTRRAHAHGALVLWDLSHSIGSVPIELDRWGVDLAVGCTYKYLNGGPGAPAFLYVRRDLQEQLLSPIWGWFGQQTPFAFDLDYQPAPGIDRFLCGTPPVLSLLALEPGLEIILEAGIERIRAKSERLTAYLLALFDTLLAPRGFTLGSPRQPERRGSHISIRHPEGYRINRALIERMNVIPDFRAPDNIRLGLSPLYTAFTDVWETVKRICTVMDDQLFTEFPLQRAEVT